MGIVCGEVRFGRQGSREAGNGNGNGNGNGDGLTQRTLRGAEFTEADCLRKG